MKPRKVSNRSLREAAGLIAAQLRQGDMIGCYVEGAGIACIDLHHLDHHGQTAFADGLDTFVHEWLHHLGWTDSRIEASWKRRASRRQGLKEFVRGL